MTSQRTRAESRSRQNSILIVVLVSVIGILGIVLYFLPWVSNERDVGFSEEARRNPYLAAEQFLSRFDVSVKTETGLSLLDKLPSPDDILLIASSRRSLSERRVNDLTDWVHAGGGLIVLASDLYAEERDDKGDRLLNNFGIWLYEGEPVTPAEVLAEAAVDSAPQLDDETTDIELDSSIEPEGSDQDSRKTFADAMLAMENSDNNCSSGVGLTSVVVDGEEQELTVQLSTNRHLWFEDSQDYAYAYNDIGAQLVYLTHGEGSIHVLTTLGQWRNRDIGCFDNAHLLRALIEGTDTLWLLFNTDIDPVHRLIWKRWYLAVLLAFFWLALWIWRSAYRTTRIEPEEPAERREVMEHIAGMSRFLYQQKELGLLLSGLRTDCFIGNPADPNQKQQLKAQISSWAGQLGIDEERISWALTANIARDSSELTNAVILLQKIRDLPKAQ